MSIHSQNEQVILEFGLKKPAFRIIVNSPTTHGSIGLTTGLDPAMTLGCGGYGGNITSDNISPRHLLNIKRLAYEITPVANRFETGRRRQAAGGCRPALPPACPQPACRHTGISADALSAGSTSSSAPVATGQGGAGSDRIPRQQSAGAVAPSRRRPDAARIRL